MQNTNVTNATHTRAFYLAEAERLKPFHPFTAVTAEEMAACERATRCFITARIVAQPSRGKTIGL